MIAHTELGIGSCKYTYRQELQTWEMILIHTLDPDYGISYLRHLHTHLPVLSTHILFAFSFLNRVARYFQLCNHTWSNISLVSCLLRSL